MTLENRLQNLELKLNSKSEKHLVVYDSGFDITYENVKYPYFSVEERNEVISRIEQAESPVIEITCYQVEVDE